jgi:hypothetical protein
LGPIRCAAYSPADGELHAIAFFCCFFEASLRRISLESGVLKEKGGLMKVTPPFFSLARIA